MNIANSRKNGGGDVKQKPPFTQRIYIVGGAEVFTFNGHRCGIKAKK
jgi:hypothetical protein